MLKLCFDLAHSMFNDGYSPSTRHGEETFGHRADDTSFCFVVYPGVIFCECGQVELFLLLLGPAVHFSVKTRKNRNGCGGTSIYNKEMSNPR